MPALGLSNKAVYDEQKTENEDKKPSLADELYKEVYFNRVELKSNFQIKLYIVLFY